MTQKQSEHKRQWALALDAEDEVDVETEADFWLQTADTLSKIMAYYDPNDVQYAERLEKRYQREHDLLNTRTSSFAVLQALLFAGSGLMARLGDTRIPPSDISMIVIWIIGVAGSLLWLALGSKSRIVQRNYSDLLAAAEAQAYPEKHRIHQRSREYRFMGLAPQLYAPTILGVVFPIISLMLWVVIAITVAAGG